ncbi:MAG: helix-turn-helix transcriptional regulator [Paracoccaceae bacterium]
MLRTDRLFEIIHILRSAAAPMSAAAIAAELEVSPRTIYRYIATLQSMRIPIEGETGVGYVMRRGYDLPPLNFNEEELEAILVGLCMISRTGDASLRKAADRVHRKIETHRVPDGSLRVSDWGIPVPGDNLMADIRAAIRKERKLKIVYQSLDGTRTERVILPIAITYFISVATVSAWCTLREDFRNFRVDRIPECAALDSYFTGESEALRQSMSNA